MHVNLLLLIELASSISHTLISTYAHHPYYFVYLQTLWNKIQSVSRQTYVSICSHCEDPLKPVEDQTHVQESWNLVRTIYLGAKSSDSVDLEEVQVKQRIYLFQTHVYALRTPKSFQMRGITSLVLSVLFSEIPISMVKTLKISEISFNLSQKHVYLIASKTCAHEVFQNWIRVLNWRPIFPDALQLKIGWELFCNKNTVECHPAGWGQISPSSFFYYSIKFTKLFRMKRKEFDHVYCSFCDDFLMSSLLNYQPSNQADKHDREGTRYRELIWQFSLSRNITACRIWYDWTLSRWSSHVFNVFSIWCQFVC